MSPHPPPDDRLDDGLCPWPTPDRATTVREGSDDDGDLLGAIFVVGVPTLGFWVAVWFWGWLWPILSLVATSLLITALCVGTERGWKLPRFFSRRSSSRRP